MALQLLKEELQLEFEQLVLQHAHIRRAIEIAEVEQNSICQGNENFKRVLYSIRHVISSALSACSKASHLHSNSAIKDIATGVLEHIAEKNDGLLAADTIQGVLCSLGRPMRLSDVNRSMHLLSELPIDGQVDVSQLVEKMFAMMPEAGDGFEPHAHSATEYFDNSKNTNVETYADKIATNQVEENIKEEE